MSYTGCNTLERSIMDYNTEELIEFFSDMNTCERPCFECEGSGISNKYILVTLVLFSIPVLIFMSMGTIYAYLLAQFYNILYWMTNPLR